MIYVIIVEDKDNIREGLCMLINGTEDYRCIGVYKDCESMLEEVEEKNPDVMLMDIGLPGISGIEGVKRVKKILPDVNVLMLTVYEDNERIFEALCAGACGYLIKQTPPARLLEAIKEAYEGGSPMSSHIARKVVGLFQEKHLFPTSEPSILSDREREILGELAKGNSYQVIADLLFISVDTVRFHIRNIYKKLHVHSQSEAVAKAIKKGLI
jgi:DNA-binding NarL/FixJ family response regulator